MIRSDKDLKLARQQIAEQQEQAGCYRASLEAEGLPADDVERLVDLRLHFSRQLADEITWYEQARTGYLGPTTLAGLGRFLVGLRIAHELSPGQLAEEQGISKGVVSRDEQNEYRNLTIERALRILDALNEEDLYIMRASLFHRLEAHLSAGPSGAETVERAYRDVPTRGDRAERHGTLTYGGHEAATTAVGTAARSIVGALTPALEPKDLWIESNIGEQTMASTSYAISQEGPLYKRPNDQAGQKQASPAALSPAA